MISSFDLTSEYRFEPRDCIGHGAFGRVYLATNTEHNISLENAVVAVKIVNVPEENPLTRIAENWEKFLQRSKKLLDLKHSHLVRYHKVFVSDTRHGKDIYFVMDFCNGRDLALLLHNLKEKETTLEYADVIRYTLEITDGLQFLHKEHIIHGDLKPANIFVNCQYGTQKTLLIGDLDDCVQMHNPVTTVRDISYYRGTVRYMSPEMLRRYVYVSKDNEAVGRKTDVWSLGCIIADMANYSAGNFENCLYNWRSKEFFQMQTTTPNHIFAETILKGFVPYVKEFNGIDMGACIEYCFSRHAEHRISASKLLQNMQRFGSNGPLGYLLERASVHVSPEEIENQGSVNFRANVAIPVGIDLGRSYSCVAAYLDGKTVTIPNDQGNRMTPSIVCFHEGDRLVGESAASQSSVCPINTMCDTKRMIGRSFDDPLVQSSMPNWGFRVVEENGKPNIVIKENGQDILLITPEQVCAMIMAKMKETVELYLDLPIADVVITVPVHLTVAQRQATTHAASVAGLNAIRMINEPTAAAIYYRGKKEFKNDQKVLVFHLGSGKLDVSILVAQPNTEFTVISANTNLHLGANNFDNALIKMLADEYDQQHQEKLVDNPEAMRRLTTACEGAMRTLSFAQNSRIVIQNLPYGKWYERTVTRKEFATAYKDIFAAILTSIQETIDEAELTVDDIQDVVLVGGSSRLPGVMELLQQFFTGKNVMCSGHPDEVVANGAAIYAAMLMGHDI